NTGSASAILKWSAPGLAKSVIPQSQLYAVAPYLNTQPTNYLFRHYGESATFGVDAGGTQLAFQWLKDDMPIPGAYSNSYTINPVVCDSAGTYKVIVANGVGSVTSDPGVLTTIIGTTEVSGPTNQTAFAGSSPMLTAVASGLGPVSYVWRKDGQVLADQTSPSLVLPSVTTNEAGLYCVEVMGPCNSATNCATLTVQQPSPPPQPNVGGLAYDAEAGTFGFSFGTAKDVTYLIEYTDKFESPSSNWTLLQTVVGDGNAAAISDNSKPLPPIRFYRVRVVTTP
ncbi:MAG: immunoglobulin domain-containing protein, partial [Verrucomicrobia bacterium]|nr:immunoglobulin domain-containing protein [Verrucomicrobiota bacterium]